METIDYNIKSNQCKFNIKDWVFFLALILQDAGTFGVLPLNIAQIIIIALGVLCILENNYLKINRNLFYLLSYMAVITVVVGHDSESIKGFCYFAIQIVVLAIYIKTINDDNKLFKIVYYAAAVLAIYAIIQEIGYLLNNPSIYDIALYGFAKNGNYTTSFGFMRTMSLYAEPAHLSSIIVAGLLIGIYGIKHKLPFVKNYITVIIALFGVLTISAVVYVSILIGIVIYVFFFEKKLSKKIKWILLIATIIIMGIIFLPGFSDIISEKLLSLKTADSTVGGDLSSFALYSNINIAIEKLKDGYLFGTGYDTHRLYYYDYIHMIYNKVLFYLNYEDAASLYTRILSEFGIVGFIWYLSFLAKSLFDAIKKKNEVVVIFLIILLVQGLRNGHYTYLLNCLPFLYVFLRDKQVTSKRVLFK